MHHANFHLNRRHFLKSAAATAGLAGLPAWFAEENLSYAATTRPLSPNDKPGIGLIGCEMLRQVAMANLVLEIGPLRPAARFVHLVAFDDVDAGAQASRDGSSHSRSSGSQAPLGPMTPPSMPPARVSAIALPFQDRSAVSAAAKRYCWPKAL